MAEPDSVKLGTRPLRLADLRRVYQGPVSVQIDPAALGAVGHGAGGKGGCRAAGAGVGRLARRRGGGPVGRVRAGMSEGGGRVGGGGEECPVAWGRAWAGGVFISTTNFPTTS